MKLTCPLFLMFFCSISFCSSQTTFRKTIGAGAPTDFIVTADHGFAITGYRGALAMLMKTDSARNVQFVQTYGTVTGMTDGNTGEDIVTLPDGGFVIAGHWAPSVAFENAWIIRTDAMGNILWDTKIPNPFNVNDTHFAEKIKRTSAGE